MDRNKFKHVVLLTYMDMEASVLPDFVAKEERKHKENFHKAYFDNGIPAAIALGKLVMAFPPNEGLKIFIAGHGTTGVQYITDDSQRRKQSVDDIVKFLKLALYGRYFDEDDKPINRDAKTRINMIVCRFGRTPDGSLDNIPAVMIHRKLFEARFYVELEARTESINHIKNKEDRFGPEEFVRKTIGVSREKRDESLNVEKVISYRYRSRFTKLLCTCVEGNTIAKFESYDDNELNIRADQLRGREFLWGENVVNEVVDRLNFVGGKPEDQRQYALWEIIKKFENGRDARTLKSDLEQVLSGKGGNVKEDFTTHRNWYSQYSSEKPGTAQFVEGLLNKFPR
jgi:hypothetical protein